MWHAVLRMCGVDPEFEYESRTNYEDAEIVKIIHALATKLGITSDACFELFGEWVVEYAFENGWDNFLTCMADSLHEFLNNLNSMHFFIDRIAFATEMRGPVFKCESLTDGTLRLHYYSSRQGLYPMVNGLVKAAARSLFNLEIRMYVTERNQERHHHSNTEHVIYAIESMNKNSSLVAKALTPAKMASIELSARQLPFSLKCFCSMFPMHICVNRQMIVEHCGDFLQSQLGLGNRRTIKLTDIVQILQPDDIHVSQVLIVNGGQNLLFVGTFNVTTVRSLLTSNVYLGDMPMHDVTRDLVMLNQSRISQQELNKKLEETVKQMRNLAVELEQKKVKTDHLLYELIPPEIAHQLRATHEVPAKEFATSTVLYVDVPHFYIISVKCTPREVIKLITDLFVFYEKLILRHNCYKVLSLIDMNMIIAGVPKPTTEHTYQIFNLALALIGGAKRIIVPQINLPVVLRAAVHSGPVVAGILGTRKIRYVIMGETVNITKRLLMHATPGKIVVTNSAKLTGGNSQFNSYEFTTKGYVNIGNKQATCTYYLERNTKKSIWELLGREKGVDNTIDGYQELHLASDVTNWADVEATVRKQQRVIAAMQSKGRHLGVATEKMRQMRETFRSHTQSNDSGISSGSGHESSSICSVM
uniref:guanylate cyclase n=1 Tax=Panagrellus redivivus TaxID=6233 RepID=A0A7E4V362_PANRE